MNKPAAKPRSGKHLYKRAMVFGTFDQLHQGHREYISRAFELADEVAIMLMSDEASRPTKIYTPHPYEKRYRQIIKFAGVMGWDTARFTIDTWRERPQLYKRMLAEPLVDVVVTGPEYLDRTLEMFQQRLELGLPQFCVVLQPRYRENGRDVSSTSIRMELAGENPV